MLVLSRKVDEEIQIGETIFVKVLRTKDGSVRLGVTAPRNIPIVRTELIEVETEPKKAA